MNKISLGLMGEKTAVKYLRKQGYKIITTNYRNTIGEIDIVAMQGDMIVFVEVKTRSSIAMGYPREAVEVHKQNKIRTVATKYLKENGCLDSQCRFDVIELIGEGQDYTIDHIQDAF